MAPKKPPLPTGPVGSTWKNMEGRPVGFDVGSDYKKVDKDLVEGVREKDPYGAVMDKVGLRQRQNARGSDPLLSAGADDDDAADDKPKVDDLSDLFGDDALPGQASEDEDLRHGFGDGSQQQAAGALKKSP